MTITDRDDEFRATITYYFNKRLGHDPNAEQMAAYLYACENGWTGEDIDANLAKEPEAIAYAARPPAPSVPHLETRGIDFVDAAGERIVLKGTDQFCAFHDFLWGGDLTPLLEESQDLKFNLWRVFLMGAASQNQIVDLSPSVPTFYDNLRPFADLLNAHGIVLLATVFVDAQVVLPRRDDQRLHWFTVAEKLRGSATLLSLGNERTKNGFDPGDFDDPGMLWSRGSDLGDNPPYRPYASFAEFHPRRDLPAALMDTVASPCFIYKTLDRPLILDEPPRMGTDGSGPEYADPRVCWQFARHYATECAGACFHSRSGQTGQLMDPLTRACAEAWSRGMKV